MLLWVNRSLKLIFFSTNLILIPCRFSGESGNDDDTVLSRKEVIRRLRDRGEPVLLFGETELQAFKRLRKCEIQEPEINKVIEADYW